MPGTVTEFDNKRIWIAQLLARSAPVLTDLFRATLCIITTVILGRPNAALLL